MDTDGQIITAMNLSFAYPVYNEIENLPRLYAETEQIARGFAGDFEMIIADDGSRDGSGDYADRLAREHLNVRVFHHGRNRGLGAAIRTGLVNATKDLVLYQDSDFPVTAEDARAALTEFDDDTDLLIGYRIGRAEGPRRELISFTYNRMIRYLFGLRVRDVNFAFKLIRRPLLEQMRLHSEGSFIDAELLLEATRLGARLKEVGIQYHSRTAGVSTAAGYRVVYRIFGELWRYWLRRRLGRLGPARLIVNADDFGLCPAVNRGIAAAFDRGIVTSASLLVTGDALEEAVAMARQRPGLDVGVHLSLTQTRPLLPPARIPSLLAANGCFHRNWRVFLTRYASRRIAHREIEAELRAQMERAASLGLAISHLDSHQHLHMMPGITGMVAQLAQVSGIEAVRLPRPSGGIRPGGRAPGETAALAGASRLAARTLAGNGFLVNDNFCGFAEAGRWDTDSLLAAVDTLESGLTEIGCHPGADDAIDDQLGWGYRWERELAALTSEELRNAVTHGGVKLTSYRQELAARG